MSAVKSVVWGIRCDRCGYSDYQAPKVSAARYLAHQDGWSQLKPSAEATVSRIDLCPECNSGDVGLPVTGDRDTERG